MFYETKYTYFYAFFNVNTFYGKLGKQYGTFVYDKMKYFKISVIGIGKNI